MRHYLHIATLIVFLTAGLPRLIATEESQGHRNSQDKKNWNIELFQAKSANNSTPAEACGTVEKRSEKIQPSTKHGMTMKLLSAEELKKKLDAKSVTLIDVREPAEHRAENIPGSLLIPLSEISFNRLPTHAEMIVIHCASGKRSAQACEQLLAEDQRLDLYSLDGGISAWKKAGFATQRTGKLCIPLERQIQITAGSIILAGVILGATVHNSLYIIPAIVGIGLMIAGISGWCGMGILLAHMPWNR